MENSHGLIKHKILNLHLIYIVLKVTIRHRNSILYILLDKSYCAAVIRAINIEIKIPTLQDKDKTALLPPPFIPKTKTLLNYSNYNTNQH